MINVDEQEIAKFEALAHRWWDADGEFKPLHDINGPRVEYIRERCTVAGSSVLDAGCGGGLLTEALHGLGGNVTGIDAGEAPLAVARMHAIEAGLEDGIRYVAATPESYLIHTDREPVAVLHRYLPRDLGARPGRRFHRASLGSAHRTGW